MKNVIKTLAIVAALLTFTSTTVNAQKIAHINRDSLISKMPEWKQAQDSVKAYAAELEQLIAGMSNEYQAKLTSYEATYKDLPEISRAAKEQEIKDLGQRIQDVQQRAQMDYQNLTTSLTEPIYEKANNAIKAVAKKNNYRYVLDTSSQVIIYYQDSDDIFVLVAKHMGLSL